LNKSHLTSNSLPLAHTWYINKTSCLNVLVMLSWRFQSMNPKKFSKKNSLLQFMKEDKDLR